MALLFDGLSRYNHHARKKSENQESKMKHENKVGCEG
jgi:hypothetical protein